jgi:hypothetical protein
MYSDAITEIIAHLLIALKVKVNMVRDMFLMVLILSDLYLQNMQIFVYSMCYLLCYLSLLNLSPLSITSHFSTVKLLKILVFINKNLSAQLNGTFLLPFNYI